MRKNGWISRGMSVVLVCCALIMTVSLATGAGTDKDPLVTLSYLEKTFMDSIMEKVDQKIADRNSQIAQQLGGQVSIGGTGVVSTFTVVTLSNGQTLTGDIGCEVMLRVGTAVCVSPSAPGLIDETDASVLNNSGALVQNHLYMMTIEGRSVKATADTTKLLVRGSYFIA